MTKYLPTASSAAQGYFGPGDGGDGHDVDAPPRCPSAARACRVAAAARPLPFRADFAFLTGSSAILVFCVFVSNPHPNFLNLGLIRVKP